MNDHDDHDDSPFAIFSHWYSFGSPVGIAILLVGFGAFLALLGAAVALPLGALR